MNPHHVVFSVPGGAFSARLRGASEASSSTVINIRRVYVSPARAVTDEPSSANSLQEPRSQRPGRAVRLPVNFIPSVRKLPGMCLSDLMTLLCVSTSR